MKTISFVKRMAMLLVAVLLVAGCNKDNNGDVVKKRDITYTVTDGSGNAGEATTVHLNTEAEWEALLERFCDYAHDGNSVTFYDANRAGEGNITKDAVTFSTTDRQAMRRWMAEMEDEGMTVTVTYDSETHTWHGIAYAMPPAPQVECFTGTLFSKRAPYESERNENAFALYINSDSVLVISINGNIVTYDYSNRFHFGGETYRIGDTLTLCGILDTIHDYYDNVLYVLEIDDPSCPDPFTTTNWINQLPDICFGDSVWIDTSSYYNRSKGRPYVALCCVPLSDSSFSCYAYYADGFSTINNSMFQDGWTYDYYYCGDGTDSLRLLENGMSGYIIHLLQGQSHICIMRKYNPSGEVVDDGYDRLWTVSESESVDGGILLGRFPARMTMDINYEDLEYFNFEKTLLTR